jgi:hypothetical protein
MEFNTEDLPFCRFKESTVYRRLGHIYLSSFLEVYYFETGVCCASVYELC